MTSPDHQLHLGRLLTVTLQPLEDAVRLAGPAQGLQNQGFPVSKHSVSAPPGAQDLLRTGVPEQTLGPVQGADGGDERLGQVVLALVHVALELDLQLTQHPQLKA